MAETKPNVTNDGDNSHKKTDMGNTVYPRDPIFIGDDDISPGFRQIPWPAPPRSWDDTPKSAGGKKNTKRKRY